MSCTYTNIYTTILASINYDQFGLAGLSADRVNGIWRLLRGASVCTHIVAGERTRLHHTSRSLPPYHPEQEYGTATWP